MHASMLGYEQYSYYKVIKSYTYMLLVLENVACMGDHMLFGNNGMSKQARQLHEHSECNLACLQMPELHENA